MNVLLIGDIVGEPGRKAVKAFLPGLKQEFQIDVTVANCENCAGGFGVVPSIVEELTAAGVDSFTTGNHVWERKEIFGYISKNSMVLRPLNFPPGVEGSGYAIVAKGDTKLAILNVMGRVFLSNLDCPFRTTRSCIEEVKKQTQLIIIDFHAEATSEKRAYAMFFDGDVSAIIGTHTHVQTADEEVLPKGTAYITDVGMTGSHDSVIGVKKEQAYKRFLTQVPVKFEVAKEDVRLSAVAVSIDDKTGKAANITRIHRKLTDASRGQAIIEYLLVVSAFVIILVGTHKLFFSALRSYYNRASTIICSPAP